MDGIKCKSIIRFEAVAKKVRELREEIDRMEKTMPQIIEGIKSDLPLESDRVQAARGLYWEYGIRSDLIVSILFDGWSAGKLTKKMEEWQYGTCTICGSPLMVKSKAELKRISAPGLKKRPNFWYKYIDKCHTCVEEMERPERERQEKARIEREFEMREKYGPGWKGEIHKQYALQEANFHENRAAEIRERFNEDEGN